MSAELVRLRGDDDELPVPEELKGSFAVLRRGVRESPGATQGPRLHADRLARHHGGLARRRQCWCSRSSTTGSRPSSSLGSSYGICGLAFVLVIVAFLAARSAGRRLVRASEEALMNLRVRTFAHIHRLSIAEQSEEKRGVFVARVTADADSLQQFTEWGGIAWLISFVQAIGALALMLVLQLAARDRRRAPHGAAGRDHGLDAGAAVGGVRCGTHPRRRDAQRGERERHGRGGRARVRARRIDPREGDRCDRAALRRGGARPSARGDALADVERVLRAHALGRDRGRRDLRSRAGDSRSARWRRSCSSATCS